MSKRMAMAPGTTEIVYVKCDHCEYTTSGMRWEGAVRTVLLHHRVNHKDLPKPKYPKHMPQEKQRGKQWSDVNSTSYECRYKVPS